jgi:hypothetical protein
MALTHTHNPIRFLMFLPVDVQQLDFIEWSSNDCDGGKLPTPQRQELANKDPVKR